MDGTVTMQDLSVKCRSCIHFGEGCANSNPNSQVGDCNEFEPTCIYSATTVSSSAEDVSNETTAKRFLNYQPYTPAGEVPAITKPDMVNHPSHYTAGGIECIKAIEASMPPDGFQDYCKGNVLKYVWRFRQKNGLEDLKKARVYLNWMIESLEKEQENNGSL